MHTQVRASQCHLALGAQRVSNLSMPQSSSTLLIASIMLLLLHTTKAFLLTPRATTTHALRRQTVRAMASSSSSDDKDKIGFIGLGYMGAGRSYVRPLHPPPNPLHQPTPPTHTQGMVRRLLEQGNDVVVWNRSPEKSAKLLSEYSAARVTIAPSPKAVLEQAGPLTFSMLSTPQAAREVFHAPEGILAGVHKGTG